MMAEINRHIDRAYRHLQLFDTSLGVSIYPAHVVLVQTRRYLRGIRMLKQAVIPFDDIKALRRQLNVLLKNEGFASDYLTLSIRPRGLLFKQLALPPMDRPALSSWLSDNIDEYLPPGMEIGGLQVKARIISIRDDGIKVLLLIYRAAEVQPYHRLFSDDEAFQVIHRGFSIEHCIAWSVPRFTGAVVDLARESTFISVYEDGHYLSHRTMPGVDILEEAAAAANSLLSNHADGAQPFAPQFIICADPALRTSLDSTQLGVDTGPALATHLPPPVLLDAFSASLQPLCSRCPDIDLTLEENRQFFDQCGYEHLTRKSFLLAGIFIVCLATLLYMLQGAFAWQYSRYEAILDSLLPLIAEREALMIRSAAREKEIENVNFMTSRRTRFAHYISDIGNALPETAWITAVEIAARDPARIAFRLTCLASRDEAIAEFMQNLEALAYARGISLKQTQVFSGKDVWRKLNRREKRIIQFRISFYA